jgi:hypothetical protein
VTAAFRADFNAAGYAFTVETDLLRLGSYVASRIAPFEIASPGRARWGPTYRLSFEERRCLEGTAFPAPYVLRVEDEEVWSAGSAGGIAEHALWLISQDAVAQIVDHIAVHAAAASRGGMGVIMPAPPDAGKTTLVAGLVNAGFSYLTDEMALINPASGWVDPFPRALWMDRRSIALIAGLAERVEDDLIAREAPSVHVRPDDLRPGAIGPSCPIALVVAPRYEPGAATVAEPMSRAEMLRLLLVNSPNAHRFGRRGPAILAGALRGADCYRLQVGDLEAGVRAVIDLVEVSGPRPPVRSSVDAPAPPLRRGAVPSLTPDAIDSAFRPLPSADVVATELDGESVLYDLATGHTHLLNPTAALLWSCFDGDSSLDDLALDVAEVYGQDLARVRESIVDVARELGRLGALDGVTPDARHGY